MHNSEWFSRWFDSKYYHILYKNRDFKEAEVFVDNLVHHLKPTTDSKILDLACGKGRHSVFLSKKGYNVTGIDLSANSIKHAKQFETDKLHFDVHDMRRMYKSDSFNLIFNLFTSFGYFENEKDNLDVLNACHAALCSGGILTIDFMNVFKVAGNLIRSESKTIDNIEFKIKRELKGKFIVKTIEFFADDKWYKFQEKVQGLTINDFKKYLNETNFEILETFGSYDLDYYSKNTSDRLILICRRN